jgi:hypothetical protein
LVVVVVVLTKVKARLLAVYLEVLAEGLRTQVFVEVTPQDKVFLVESLDNLAMMAQEVVVVLVSKVKSLLVLTLAERVVLELTRIQLG